MLCGCSSDNESLYKEKRLSEDQIQILVSAGFDEDRIRRNDLTSVDYRVIEDYQYAHNYLEEKYESNNFSLIECSLGTKSTYSLFTGTVEGFPSESFDIQVSSSGDIRSARDNCYRIIKKEEYADLLQEVISCVEKECLDVELYCNELYGDNDNFWPDGMFWIVIDGWAMSDEECEEVIDQIEDELIKKDLTGDYRLLFYGSDSEYENWIYIP